MGLISSLKSLKQPKQDVARGNRVFLFLRICFFARNSIRSRVQRFGWYGRCSSKLDFNLKWLRMFTGRSISPLTTFFFFFYSRSRFRISLTSLDMSSDTISSLAVSYRACCLSFPTCCSFSFCWNASTSYSLTNSSFNSSNVSISSKGGVFDCFETSGWLTKQLEDWKHSRGL